MTFAGRSVNGQDAPEAAIRNCPPIGLFHARAVDQARDRVLNFGLFSALPSVFFVTLRTKSVQFGR